MAHLWKWLGLAAALYGLIAVWALTVQQRPRAQQQQAPAIEALENIDELDQLFMQAPRGDELVAGRIDFESDSLPPYTDPPTDTAIIESPDGGHQLRWEFVAGEIAPHGLMLPLRGAAGVKTLRLRIRADRQTKLAVGLREADGSMFMSPQMVGPEQQLYEIELASMSRHRQVPDENNKLDAEQINALIVIHRAKSQKVRQHGLVGFELDDIELR